MTTEKTATKVDPKAKLVKELKKILADELEFLKKQRSLPYTLPDQADAIGKQITLLTKYLH